MDTARNLQQPMDGDEMKANDEPRFVDGHALVGLTGEFTAADGEVYQCLVTGTDIPPWDNDLLIIDYVARGGMKVTNAMIPASAFRACYVAEMLEGDLCERTLRLNNAERILRELGYERCTAAECNCSSYHRMETATVVKSEGMRGKRKSDRKDKVETVLAQAQKLDGTEAIQAWRRLCRELGHMTHPEARMPRFNGLLHAVWIAASNDHT